MCERELETEQNCNILTPTLMAISVVYFLFSWTTQPGAWGPSLSGTCSHPSIFSPTGIPRAPSVEWWLSLSHLVSNSSDLQLPRGSQRPLLLGAGFLYHILSLTHLISDSLTSCLIELYNSSIAHSIFGMACLIIIKRK